MVLLLLLLLQTRRELSFSSASPRANSSRAARVLPWCAERAGLAGQVEGGEPGWRSERSGSLLLGAVPTRAELLPVGGLGAFDRRFLAACRSGIVSEERSTTTTTTTMMITGAKWPDYVLVDDAGTFSCHMHSTLAYAMAALRIIPTALLSLLHSPRSGGTSDANRENHRGTLTSLSVFCAIVLATLCTSSTWRLARK